MSPTEAARVLGVAHDAEWEVVRLAYRRLIRTHHPDRAGSASAARAARINEAYRVLEHEHDRPAPPSAPAGSSGPGRPAASGSKREDGADVSDLATEAWRRHRHRAPEGLAPPVYRVDGDSLLVAAPADETFRWLLEAAHDIGEITYVDGSVPILEVLCQFEGEPATSLLITLQGRAAGTEAFCTVESIEQRPAPPVESVVDLLELALHRRAHPAP